MHHSSVSEQPLCTSDQPQLIGSAQLSSVWLNSAQASQHRLNIWLNIWLTLSSVWLISFGTTQPGLAQLSSAQLSWAPPTYLPETVVVLVVEDILLATRHKRKRGSAEQP